MVLESLGWLDLYWADTLTGHDRGSRTYKFSQYGLHEENRLVYSGSSSGLSVRPGLTSEAS
jgi:hypothetical protein